MLLIIWIAVAGENIGKPIFIDGKIHQSSTRQNRIGKTFDFNFCWIFRLYCLPNSLTLRQISDIISPMHDWNFGRQFPRNYLPFIFNRHRLRIFYTNKQNSDISFVEISIREVSVLENSGGFLRANTRSEFPNDFKQVIHYENHSKNV